MNPVVARVSNMPLLATLATVVLFAAVPMSAPVQATTAIQRCVTSDGTAVYTDKACTALGATHVPIPGALLTRIAHEEARFNDTDEDGGAPATMPAAPGRRAVAGGCARTPTQLAMDLRGALALGDVNRVAESYDWLGMSTREGERTLDRLQHLIGKPVVDSHYFDAQIASAEGIDGATLLASNGGIGGDAGVLQLILGADASRSAIDFDVHKVRGCYFVRF